MRYVDLQQSIPAFFVVIIAQQALGFVNESYGGSLLLIVVVFGLLNWGGVARIVQSEALQLREEEYVEATRSAGASRFDVIRRHVVPNALTAIFTALTVQVGWLLLLETTLSYLGIGSATHPSWGYVMTTSVRNQFFPTFYWWGVAFPALALGAVVVSLQTLGDAPGRDRPSDGVTNSRTDCFRRRKPGEDRTAQRAAAATRSFSSFWLMAYVCTS